MNTATPDLDRWAVAAERTTLECEMAELLLLGESGLSPGETQIDKATTAAALSHVTRARENAWKMYRGLLDAGAAPVEGHGVPTPDADPLRALAQADTPATRRLLAAVRAAVAVAEEVDAERGHVLPAHLPLQPGESRGTGWAETLSELALRLKIEVEGPADRRQGRE